jgi:cytochrome c biogenesis protein CcmG/thiol:disulfide interchange protein DsbE
MLAKDATEATAVRRRIVMLMPLAGFLALALLFWIGLRSGDRSHIPSALIGHDVPAMSLPPVAGLERDGRPVPGLAPDDFRGAVTLVNIWASWCQPCHEEVPLLLRLADDSRIRLVGINYKDQADNARRFLGRYGNPFVATGVDADGSVGREWGVYGVPETFVVGRDGKIAFKLIGQITAHNLDAELMPAIEKAIAAQS